MKIRTNLPHEKGDGHTLVLFGEPRVEFGYLTGADGSISVHCHLISVTEKSFQNYSFERLETQVSKSQEIRMRKYARSLAQKCLKKGYKIIKSEVNGYQQNNIWSGFMFFIKRKKYK